MNSTSQSQSNTHLWDSSYGRRENFVFSPSDEVVRFFSRSLRRRVGLDEIVDVYSGANGTRVIDIGCGLGRNVVFGVNVTRLNASAAASPIVETRQATLVWLGYAWNL